MNLSQERMLMRHSDHIEKTLLLELDSPLTYKKKPMAFITCAFSGLGFAVLHWLSSPCEVGWGDETVTILCPLASFMPSALGSLACYSYSNINFLF